MSDYTLKLKLEVKEQAWAELGQNVVPLVNVRFRYP